MPLSTARKHIHLAFNIIALAMVVAAASPSPSPTPSGPSDPCGSILTVVNRPPITTGVCAVPSHQFDVETGWQNTTTTGAGGGNTAIYGATLIRFGTGNNHLDLELTPPTYAVSSAGGPPNVTGWTDSAIGMKYEMGYNARAVWGVNGVVTLPTGSRSFSAGGAQYSGNFNFGYTLNPTFGVSGTLGFNEFRTAGQSYFAFTPSLLLTATLPANSELFGEYAYVSTAGVGLQSKSIYDFGYVKALGDHWQFDIEYGISPTVIGGQQQHYIGTGLSFMH
jgi:hypothetical protein